MNLQYQEQVDFWEAPLRVKYYIQKIKNILDQAVIVQINLDRRCEVGGTYSSVVELDCPPGIIPCQS